MALEKYQSKRKFDRTPEPSGKVKLAEEGPLRFVIQKHHASHLHYDFRLEIDGVLVSWAVPKGPSLNPKDKRLAMAVEDHPMDYRTFEGIIPKGNYGAGTVIIWDEGEYYVDPKLSREANQKLLRKGLKSGKLTFTLQGKKLHGEFALVKTRGREENAWLLLKHDDAYASTEDITLQEYSVVTHRTLDDVKHHRPPLSVVPKDLPSELIAPMPHKVKPMLATLVNAPFNREGWVFEIKWDGYRAIAEVGTKQVKLYSRNLNTYETKFDAIFEQLQQVKTPMVLDGEVVALDDDGKPSFQLLQDAVNQQHRLVYYVFDLLYLDGYSVETLTLLERKALLKQHLPVLPQVRYCDHVETTGTDFFKLVQEQGLEGVIAKDAESPYFRNKRTQSWLKIKTHLRQEAIIAGYTEPRGGRKNMGSLILGIVKDGQLTYIGHTGTGMDAQTLKNLKSRLDTLAIEQCPFAGKPPKTNAPVHWVEPRFICEVKFQEWTKDGHMRQPVFLGLREDKAANEVVKEEVKPVTSVIKKKAGRKKMAQATKAKNKVARSPHRLDAKKETQTLELNGVSLKLSNLNKVLWPDEGYTKRDLINYYLEMAPIILPYLKDRPINLLRHPNGIEAQGFFQKNHDHAPDWAHTVDIYSESNDKDIHYLVCENEATLVYLANLGCIEMNPWNSRIDRLDNPDYMVMDLDPEHIGFDKVIETALVVHDILESAGIENYCKTSGATGLHIYVPMGSQYDYGMVKDFAHLIGTLVHQRTRGFTSLERSPSKRQKKIYLDYLQNRFGQTLACAYGVRPKPHATVSTPLLWNEVKPGLDPTAFTIHTIQKRLDQHGDLWQPALGKGIDLMACLKSLEMVHNL